GSPAGGFKFQVTDGLNQGSPHVFTVNARPLKIRLEHNKTLSVLPGSQQSITRDHLLARTGDRNRDVSFVVVQQPRLGTLLRENPQDGTLIQLSRFTQADIDNYLVLYEHRAPMSQPVEHDSLLLDLETANAAPVTGVLFGIRIALGDSVASLLGTLQVTEGGRTPLASAMDVAGLQALWRGKPDVPPRLRLCVLSAPIRGWLELDQRNVTVPLCVAAHRLDQLIYVHDDSETLEDSIRVGLFLAAASGDRPDLALHNGTLRVTVHPVNDRPFTLETPNPVVRVATGYRKTLSSSILRTSDEDGSSAQIVYQVLRQDESACMVVLDETDVAAVNFTQKDIDDGRVSLVHDGSTTTPNTLRLLVSDGVHAAVSVTLLVEVEPVVLRVSNGTGLRLTQGDARVVISPTTIGASTNGDLEELVYNVTTEPRLGQLVFPDGAVADEFTHGDLEQGLVVYEQHDLSGPEDSFVVTVSCGQVPPVVHRVEVNVEALVRQRPLMVQSARSALITVDHLDASKLAARTNSKPRYRVTRSPTYGLLLLSGSPNSVLEFTHEDVLNETLVYHSHAKGASTSRSDHFDFELTAAGVQPGVGRFLIHLQPPSPAAAPTTPSSRDADSNDTGTERPPGIVETGIRVPLLTNDHLVVIGVAAGILLLLTVIAVVGVACGACRSRGGVGEKPRDSTGSRLSSARGPGAPNEDTPSPPAAPPTSPSSTSSEPAQGVADMDCLPPPYAGSTEVSPAVPTCKVTPLGLVENLKAPSEAASESDDWNGDVRFSAPTTVLRKNQYWV
ncbi:unnamed protein product, partial [Ixodes hexagonus]